VSYDHWRAGARDAYEEMSCLVSAGATGEELNLIAGRLPMALDGTPEELARAAGYREAAAWVAERQLYREDAEREAGFDAEPGP
jgi:hypothetical protein